MRYKGLLVIKYVHRNDYSYNYVIKPLEDIEYTAGYVRHDVFHAGQQRIGRPFGQRIGQISEDFRCILLYLGVVL